MLSLLAGRVHAADRFANVSSAMQQCLAQKEAAGIVTLIATPSKVLHVDATGFADIDAKIPMQTNSLCRIMSTTKLLTATAIMMLQDEGKLSIDDPLAKYIPELGDLKTADGKPGNLTLRHLLTHTSGMPEATLAQYHKIQKLADAIPFYVGRPLAFEPGTKWEYCQSGINTLGRIVEIVSGQAYPDFLQKRLFDPLGMKDTTFYLDSDQLPRMARCYQRTNGTLIVEDTLVNGHEPTDRTRYPAPNSGLFSTAPDFARFCQMILNGGKLDGKRYLKAKTVKQMTSIQTGDLKTGFTPGNGWGLGWCVVRHPQGITAMLSPGTCGHGGAFGTQAWIDPKKKLIYILMYQRANFPINADDTVVRRSFQVAAAKAMGWTEKP
ncbi:MAG: serine hydrolase domain-containing protein [Limisphaerales bacterium]